MNHYLLTWYGITDLRAALGFEQTGGPVLGALVAGNYSHVLVLAYTDPSKVGQDFLSMQEKYAAMLDRSGTALNREEQVETVDAFANTPQGHDLFREWLHGELKALELGVKIRFVPRDLASLTDAKGTYAAAAEALDVVLSAEGERRVTLYLSPGTPVMAFTWALVSMVNPDLDLRMIAAPDHRREPGEIQMPFDLLVPSTRQRRVVKKDREEFDAVFHLFGEQRLPSLLGILQFQARKHVFVSSPKYPAECMRQFIPEGAEFATLEVNPFDPMSTNVEVLRCVAGMAEGAQIGFNMTGGTKLMFAGAQTACRKVGGVPFYFETRDHRVVFLDDFATLEVRGVDDVERFIELGGFRVSRSGRWDDNPLREQRRSLTRTLWRKHSLVRKLYSQLADITDRGPHNRQFSIQAGGVSASLDTDDRGRIRFGSSEHVVEECPDFASYLCGGWLEEYVYALLEPLLRAGTIRDLRIGLEVAWTPTPADRSEYAAQEFDITFTDGKRLFILECKAGHVLNDHVYKLESSVRKYGGVEARGLLVSAFMPRPPLRRRLDSARNLFWWSGDKVPAYLARGISAVIGDRKGGS